MDITIIPANEYRRERWKNGLGWTREIFRSPVGSEGWNWRLSIAEVEKDGPFSTFPGVDRELVLLSGEGMRLLFDDEQQIELLPPHDRARFAGERPLRAALIDGATQDFNLMWRRDYIDASLLHRPLVGPMVFFAEPGVTWAVFVMSGRAMFKDQPQPKVLEQGDTALFAAGPDGGRRLILEGGGEVLLVRIQAKA